MAPPNSADPTPMPTAAPGETPPSVGGPFPSCEAAEDWLSTHSPDVAIPDTTLQDGNSAQLAKKPCGREIPFVVVSPLARRHNDDRLRAKAKPRRHQTKETSPPKHELAWKHENKPGLHSPFSLNQIGTLSRRYLAQFVSAIDSLRGNASRSNGYEANSSDGARNLQMVVVGSIAWRQAFLENGEYGVAMRGGI